MSSQSLPTLRRMKRAIALLFFITSVAHARADALQERIAAIVAKTPATVGIAALDVESGRRFALRGDERFPMGSVFKFPLALAFLERVDRGEYSLDAKITIPPSQFAAGWSPIRDRAHGKAVTLTYREVVAAALRDSDNTAADVLLAKLGGGAVVTQKLRSLGVTAMRVDRSEKQMAVDLKQRGGVEKYAADVRDTCTPNAALELLRRFARAEDGLSPASHAFALQMMTDSTTGPKRIKALLPKGTSVAHKTGTMPGTANDIAIITSADGKRHVLLAIFTKAATVETLDARERAVAEIAKALFE
jgi:beta-lactamase class A